MKGDGECASSCSRPSAPRIKAALGQLRSPRQERGLGSLPLFFFAFHSPRQQAKLPGWAPFGLTASSPRRIHALSPRRSRTLGAPSFPRNVPVSPDLKAQTEHPSPAAGGQGGVRGQGKGARLSSCPPPEAGPLPPRPSPACKFQPALVFLLQKSGQNHPNQCHSALGGGPSPGPDLSIPCTHLAGKASSGTFLTGLEVMSKPGGRRGLCTTLRDPSMDRGLGKGSETRQGPNCPRGA